MKNKNLHNIKKSGFKTPQNYFEELDDTIFSKLVESNISENIHRGVFKVPTDYFETVESNILNAVDKSDSTKVVSLFSWKKVAYLSGIAASILLVMNIFFRDTNPVSFGDLETASIENYLLNEDLNAYDIAPYLGTTDLDSEDFVDTNVNASAIEDYLLQNSDFEHLITD